MDARSVTWVSEEVRLQGSTMVATYRAVETAGMVDRLGSNTRGKELMFVAEYFVSADWRLEETLLNKTLLSRDHWSRISTEAPLSVHPTQGLAERGVILQIGSYL